jgi:hypothetical protein
MPNQHVNWLTPPDNFWKPALPKPGSSTCSPEVRYSAQRTPDIPKALVLVSGLAERADNMPGAEQAREMYRASGPEELK